MPNSTDECGRAGETCVCVGDSSRCSQIQTNPGNIRARIFFVSPDSRHTSNSGSQQRKSTQQWSRTIRLTTDEKVSIDGFSVTRSGIREWRRSSTLGNDRVAVIGGQIKILSRIHQANLWRRTFSDWLIVSFPVQ